MMTRREKAGVIIYLLWVEMERKIDFSFEIDQLGSQCLSTERILAKFTSNIKSSVIVVCVPVIFLVSKMTFTALFSTSALNRKKKQNIYM